MKDLMIKFGRKISRETELDSKTGIIIAAPKDKSGIKAAKKLKKRFLPLCDVKILHNPDHSVLVNSKSPVVVIGNLANSKCVEYMYYKFLCITDKTYPGKKGYNIRSIIDPFATGFNIIHIGYSDNKGLVKGIKAFLDKLKNPIPYWNEVSYTELPFDEEYLESIKNTRLPENIELIPSIHTSFWWLLGYITYLTGDEKPFETYLKGWEKMIEVSKKDPAFIKSTHLYMTQHIESWRMLDYAGMIPDDIRGDIEKCIFQWAQSREGIKYAASHSGGEDLPSHNHTMFCGLSLTYAADFFGKHYPDLKQPKQWKKVADDVFYTFNNGGWKPYCDDSSYSNQVSLALVCNYAIFKDEHVFLDNSGKKAAEWVKAIIGQNGIIPSFGDGTVRSPFPGTISRVFSHYYQDGEMKYLHDKMYHDKKYKMGVGRQRFFDSGVKPVKPKQSSMISLIPLDKYIYDIWEKDPKQGRRLTMTQPKGTFDQSFDKVSVRTGSDEHDDFLLIDGLGSNGVHSYSDTMGILDYTSKGIVWLVEENCYRWPEPENCSVVTIAKDGYASDVPGYAIMEEKKIINENCVYLRMRSKNYNSMDWIREIYLIKGVCVVFHDTITANDKGEYVIAAHFRTPAKAELEKNVLKSKRQDRHGNKYQLRLKGYGSSDITMKLDEIPYGEKLFSYGGMYGQNEESNHFTRQSIEGKKMWKRRYNNENIVVSSLTTLASSKLNKGEKLSFSHVVHPAKPNEEYIEFETLNNKICLKYKDETYEFPVAYSNKTFGKKIKKTVKKTDRGKLKLKEQLEFKNSTVDMINTGDGYVTALEGGVLAQVKNGKVSNEITLEGEINALDYIHKKDMVIAGHGNNKLSAIVDGDIVWERQTKRIPTLYASWEMAYPKVVKIKHMCNGSDTVITAGCGDNQIRTYNTRGDFLKAIYIYATVPDVIEFVDVNFDGQPEVLAAGSQECSSGTFYVHDIKGNPGRNISVGGWLSNIRSHKILCENDKYIFICGMNYERNFKILSIEKGKVDTVCEKSLGGTVNSICTDESNSVIIAGTSKGSVLAFDRKGKHLWHTFVNDAVKELYYGNNKIIVVCETGKISLLTSKGKVIATESLPGKPTCSLYNKDELLIGCKNKCYTTTY